ncbi:MAG: XdhC family protein [Phycisphaerales bacterium]|nr:XdhC family protein [Phycisphaerales bacterium]
MSELEQIIRGWRAAQARGAESLLATVVRVGGSTYRRPGARMLLTRDGERVGAISGGCLEREVGRKAWWRTERERAAVVRFDTSADDDVAFAFGLGCQGVVWVLLERGEDAALLLDVTGQRLAQRHTTIAATIIESADPALRVGARALLSPDGALLAGELPGSALFASRNRLTGLVPSAPTSRFQLDSGLTLFLERIAPPPTLVICGSGYDVAAMIAAGLHVGWRVVVCADGAAGMDAARAAGASEVLGGAAEVVGAQIETDDCTAIVLMTHNFSADVAWLRHWATTGADYIGLLGPASRAAALCAEMEKHGVALTDSLRSRLFGPVGLDLGAETPSEIAASVIAEILAIRNRRSAGPLRDLGRPIHTPAADEGSPTDGIASGPARPTCRS